MNVSRADTRPVVGARAHARNGLVVTLSRRWALSALWAVSRDSWLRIAWGVAYCAEAKSLPTLLAYSLGGPMRRQWTRWHSFVAFVVPALLIWIAQRLFQPPGWALETAGACLAVWIGAVAVWLSAHGKDEG